VGSVFVRVGVRWTGSHSIVGSWELVRISLGVLWNVTHTCTCTMVLWVSTGKLQ